MKITAAELQHAYRNMSDGELLSLNRSELTDVARACQDEELDRRGLTLGRAAAAAIAPDVDAGDEPWVSAGTFRFVDEAQMVLPILQSAGIPAELEDPRGDFVWMGASAYKASRVLVPESMLEDAHSIIQSHTSAEELAAQEGADPTPQVITARYEDGVFKPLEPIELEEGLEVEIHLPR